MVMNDLRGHFRPEFLNRLDEIIMFKPLTKDNITHIIDLMIARHSTSVWKTVRFRSRADR